MVENPAERKNQRPHGAHGGDHITCCGAATKKLVWCFDNRMKMASFSVCCSASKESILAIGGKKTKIALRRCTPSASQNLFSEKFSASTGSNKEKSGLKKGEDDDTKMTKSHISNFSHGELKVHKLLGVLCIGSY